MVMVIYGLIAAALLVGVGFAVYKWILRKDFKNAVTVLERDDIQQALVDPNADHEAIAAILFQNKAAQERYKSYAWELSRGANSGMMERSIGDFFTEDWLAEISWSGICDLIPGALTGLGILGTFLGLITGIGGISTGTAEQITLGIDTLLGGMSTAFKTSIVGVGASLGISILTKLVDGKLREAMEQFLNRMHVRNLDKTSEQPTNQMLAALRDMTRQMKKFPELFADELQKSMSPVFDSTESLIREFGDFTMEQQQKGLEHLVEKFIESMDRALGSQFEELSRSVEVVGKWQQRYIQEMTAAMDSISGSAREIASMNASSRQTVTEMRAFLEEVRFAQSGISQEVGLMQKRVQDSLEAGRKQEECVEKLSASMEQFMVLGNELRAQMEEAFRSISSLSHYCSEQTNLVSDAAKKSLALLEQSAKAQSDDLTERSGQTTRQLLDAAKVLDEAAKRMEDGMESDINRSLAAFDKELASVIEHFSGTLLDLKEATEAIPALLQQSEESYAQILEKLQQETADCADAMNGLTAAVRHENGGKRK